MATSTPQIIGWVDTHRDLHVAAAIDPVGRLLGHRSFPATPAGYRAMLGGRSLSTVLRRQAGLFTEPPPVSARVG